MRNPGSQGHVGCIACPTHTPRGRSHYPRLPSWQGLSYPEMTQDGRAWKTPSLTARPASENSCTNYKKGLLLETQGRHSILAFVPDFKNIDILFVCLFLSPPTNSLPPPSVPGDHPLPHGAAKHELREAAGSAPGSSTFGFHAVLAAKTAISWVKGTGPGRGGGGVLHA